MTMISAPARTAAALLGGMLFTAPAAAQGMSALGPIMMLIPPELLGLLCFGLLIAGGFALIVGARQQGWSMVATGILLPIITMVVTAIVNDLFAFIPEALVMSVAILLQLLFYALLVIALLKMMVSQRAWDDAMGRLLARGIEGALRLVFATRIGLGLLAVMILWLGIKIMV